MLNKEVEEAIKTESLVYILWNFGGCSKNTPRRKNLKFNELIVEIEKELKSIIRNLKMQKINYENYK